MKKSLLLIGLASYLPFMANAEIAKKEMVSCAANNNKAERIACYDTLARTKKSVSKNITKNPPGKGKWNISEKINTLTDKHEYFALLDADSGKSRWNKPFYLEVSCTNSKTSFYIGWNQFITRRGHLVTYRVGKELSKTSKWDASTDKKTSLFPDSPIPVLKKIINSDSFISKVIPYNGNPITAVFDTKGADVALADIRKACNW